MVWPSSATASASGSAKSATLILLVPYTGPKATMRSAWFSATRTVWSLSTTTPRGVSSPEISSRALPEPLMARTLPWVAWVTTISPGCRLSAAFCARATGPKPTTATTTPSSAASSTTKLREPRRVAVAMTITSSRTSARARVHPRMTGPGGGRHARHTRSPPVRPSILSYPLCTIGSWTNSSPSSTAPALGPTPAPRWPGTSPMTSAAAGSTGSPRPAERSKLPADGDWAPSATLRHPIGRPREQIPDTYVRNLPSGPYPLGSAHA